MARLATFIYSTTTRGGGTEGDPCRTVDQLFTLEGRLVAQNDPWPQDGSYWTGETSEGEAKESKS